METILERVNLQQQLAEQEAQKHNALIKERYSLEDMNAPLETLKGIAANRRCFKKGEELDLEKAASMLIDDFRSGKLGHISLEWPEEFV